MKLFKQIMFYVIPLFIGILITVFYLYAEKIQIKNSINEFFYRFPDSLISHIPRIDTSDRAFIGCIPGDILYDLGGAVINLYIDKNQKIEDFIIDNNLNQEYEYIDSNNIFTIGVDFNKKEYHLKYFNKNSLYPFPNLINRKTFKNYRIIFYEFKKGKFLTGKKLKENKNLNDEWKHGYSRGIAINKENEYTFWTQIW